MYPHKEVYFKCANCEYKDKKEDESPCFECLARPVNLYSHTPVKFKKRKNKKLFSRRIR